MKKDSFSATLLYYIRTYPLSVCCLLLIWYLCVWFMPPQLPELRDVPFIDKWTHFVMYGGTCAVIWWEYRRSHGQTVWWRLLLWGWLAPIAMSGVIELVQANCTENRAGEWLDLAANATGATIGAAVGFIIIRLSARYTTTRKHPDN